jgi:hypothetical protein
MTLEETKAVELIEQRHAILDLDPDSVSIAVMRDAEDHVIPCTGSLIHLPA